MKNKVKSDGSPMHVGDHLVAALTQQEIAQLLEALCAVLSPELREKGLAQLRPDTRRTVQHILSPPQTTSQTTATDTTPVSLAKLAQTWSALWDEWDGIVAEAAQEEGKYMAQEARWEPPYFDTTAFIDDLEKVAEHMRPLLQTAFQHGFAPETGFAQALREAEEEIADAMPEWMEIEEGFYLEEHLTTCLLQWEWLTALEEGQEAFHFAQRLRTWEDKATFVTLEDDAFLDFFTQLSEADQRLVFAGLTVHQETPLWKNCLGDTSSHWHALYMRDIEQYAPERYLEALRPTIAQQWQNGLPVIEGCLANKNYRDSQAVVTETLAALLQGTRGDTSWTPETSLLFSIVGRLHYGDEHLESQKTLLRYYQQTAQGLGQSQRVNALEIQLRACDHFFDWQVMLKAFAEIAVPTQIRQALLQAWRDHIIQRARPHSGGFGVVQTSDTWWLHWLIESIVEPQKGPAWFQTRIVQWLAGLPGRGTSLGEDYAFLRLLTKDVTEMSGRTQHQYPRFYRVVVRPAELSTPDDASRQAYLRCSTPDDVWDRIMAYWKEHLHLWVPRPERAQQSDYTAHAQWMAALHEVAPRAYETLLQRWRVEHQRRRNLWQALAKMGLE